MTNGITRFLPGLPLTCALVLWVWLSVLLPLNDYDYFWHLELGRWIVEHGWSLPMQDPFSFTASQESGNYRVQGWLFDVIQHQVWRVGGDSGMRMFMAAIIALTWSVVYRAVRLNISHEFLALVITGFGVIVAWRFFTPRPTAVTFLFFATVAMLLLRYRHTGHARQLLALPVLFALWINLHPGFLAGLALVLLFSSCAALDRWMPVAGSRSAPGRLSAIQHGLLIVGCVAALALNPYGINLLPETLGKAATDAASVVNEWQSPDFKLAFAQLFLALLLSWIAAVFFANRRSSWIDLLLPLTLSAMALQSLRHIPLATIALVMGLAQAVASRDAPWVLWRGPGLRRRTMLQTEPERAQSDSGHRWVNAALIVICAGLAFSLAPAIERRQQVFQEHKLPVQAVEFIKHKQLDGPMFNDYHLGGYLIRELGPRVPVFIDGRYNPFVGPVLEDYLTIRQLKQGWRDRLSHYGIRLVVIEDAQDGLGAQLVDDGHFRPVYSDSRFAVLLHRDAGRPDLPAVDLKFKGVSR
jgi:hypothetical protein